ISNLQKQVSRLAANSLLDLPDELEESALVYFDQSGGAYTDAPLSRPHCMVQECMLWRKKKPVSTTDVQRDVDMGGSTQPPAGMDAAPTVDGAGSVTNAAMDSTGLTDSAKELMLLEAGGANLTDLPPTSDAVPQRFQIKRWSACVYWSWDVMHDTCVICRNAMMSLCIHCQAKVGTNPLEEVCAIAWGVC
ncbi:hypothetical protein X801_08268, partial [Opisthorchis viverrini]